MDTHEIAKADDHNLWLTIHSFLLSAAITLLLFCSLLLYDSQRRKLWLKVWKRTTKMGIFQFKSHPLNGFLWARYKSFKIFFSPFLQCILKKLKVSHYSVNAFPSFYILPLRYHNIVAWLCAMHQHKKKILRQIQLLANVGGVRLLWFKLWHHLSVSRLPQQGISLIMTNWFFYTITKKKKKLNNKNRNCMQIFHFPSDIWNPKTVWYSPHGGEWWSFW